MEERPTQRSQEQPGGELSVEERASRGAEGSAGKKKKSKALTFVPKRINENINVAAGTAEC